MEGTFRWGAILLALLVPLHAGPVSAALVPTAPGACASLGDPPETLPAAQLSDCGPRIVLRVITPFAATELDVGTCFVHCALTIVIDLILCSDFGEHWVHAEAHFLETGAEALDGLGLGHLAQARPTDGSPTQEHYEVEVPCKV